MVERRAMRGAARDDPLQQVIAGYLRSPIPEEACVVPVVVGKRVVNLLCVQTAQGTSFEADSVKALSAVGVKAAVAYARVIRRQKRAER
jgi:hypothetical protein